MTVRKPLASEEKVKAPARLRFISAIIKSVTPRPTREIGYNCDECDGKWVDVTAARVVPASACPFCGGRARVVRVATWRT